MLFASGADLQSINPLVTVHPLAKQVQKHVLLMPLAAYDSLLNAQPRLASWTWNGDQSVLTFALRNDVYWHDGVQTTAPDVVWTLQMAQHPETGYPRRADLSAVSAIDEIDSLTVVVRFDQPQPTFPDVLTDLSILPAHLFANVAPGDIRTHGFNRAPVGNGPFRFGSYKPNQRWVFERNDAFPGVLGRPQLERFVVVVVNEPTTKLAALTSGELDAAGISPAHASFVRADPRLEVRDYPVFFAVGLVWNLRREPFDDVRVRRALTMALDRSVIVEAFLYGFGEVADGPVSPGHPWFVAPPVVPYQPDSAARLLQSLGWTRGERGVLVRDGVDFSFDLLTVSSDNTLEQLVQAQLAEIGVRMTIRQLELSSFLDAVQGADRDFDVMITGIPGDPALGHVAAMYRGEDPGPLAYPGYARSSFDRALADVRDAATTDALTEAWQRAQRIVNADLPTTWLYHARGVQGVNRRVTGIAFDVRGELATIAEWRVNSEGGQE